jgi:hypothetical protein
MSTVSMTRKEAVSHLIFMSLKHIVIVMAEHAFLVDEIERKRNSLILTSRSVVST